MIWATIAENLPGGPDRTGNFSWRNEKNYENQTKNEKEARKEKTKKGGKK